MSTTIDERVVEMRFDNKHFESNVATSMSTLEKLKQKLNLSGASKGLENLNAASNKVDFSKLENTATHAGFQIQDIWLKTASVFEYQVARRIVNAGKNIASALTIDPITTGFKEYETQINSVQTILANTQSKGTTIDDVTAALDELNKYADMTIYNFTEMTRNIGTFTAAGIDLDTSVNAIQGIANLAAVSGSTSQQASTAMYQLSQALSTGTVRLMDWNSVVNAGMGGEVFQNALKETSRLLETGVDAAIEAKGSFRESLSEGWLTAEVLTETLKKFTTSGAAEYLAKFTGESQETVDAILEETDAWGDEADAIDKAAEALAKKSGKNKDEIKSALQMAKTATEAATKVKTFSQLWDVMKEAAQSGWAKTWQIIIGDFEEAKSLLTPLSDFFTGVINKMSDWRNNLLESALGKGFRNLADTINGVLEPASKAAETVSKVTDSVSDLGDIVNKVIRGDFGNGQERFNALTEAGENYYRIQNKVNETLGNSYRYSEDQITAQDKLIGKQGELAATTTESQEATVELTDAQKDNLKTLVHLSNAALKSKGYTDEQIAALNELKNTAKQLGMPIDEFIDKLDEINGRWLLINSFKNIGKSLIAVFTSIGKAWQGIFDPIQADSIFDAIAAFHKFTASLIPNEEASKNLTRTFKGLFAVLDIVKTVLGGGINIAFKVLSAVLGAFDLNILDVTANIGDALVAFRDWLFENNALAESFNGLIDKLPGLISDFKEWFAAFKETPAVQKLVDAIEAIGDAFNKLTSGEIDISEFARSLGENLANAIKSLPEIAIQIGKDFIAGFQNGIEFSVSDVINKIVDFCLNFIDGFKDALGVQSPSWKAYETATDFFQGFINGAKAMIDSVLDVLKGIGEQIVKVFKSFWDFITDESGNVEWGKIFAGGSIVAGIWVLKQLADSFSSIAGVFDGIGDVLSGAGKTLKSFSKVLNGVAWDLKAGAMQKMAIAIGILVASIWVLTTIDDPGKLRQAVAVIVILAGVLVGLSVAMDKLGSASVDLDAKSKTLNIKGIQNSIIQLGLAILLIAAAVKLIGGMDEDEAKQGFIGLAGIAVGMVVFLAAMGGISRYSGEHISGIGSMMKKLAVAMILMVVVCKLAGTLDANEILKGAAFAAGFAIFVMAITAVAKNAGEHVSKVGGMVLKLTIAMALMVGVCKLASLLSVEEMLKGAAFAAGFAIFVMAITAVAKNAGEHVSKVSGLVLSMSLSLMMMVAVCKLVGMLSVEEMLKGAAFVAGFVVLLKALVSILTIGNEQEMARVAGTILAMSAAIAILAGVSVLLSFMDTASLAKGIIAVGLLSGMMTIMVKSLKGAQNAKGAILMMAITIGVMAAAVAALSFIPVEDLLPAAGAMAIMMGAFALMVKGLKGIKDVKVGPLIVLTGVVLVLAGIVALLSLLDPKSVLPNAAGLSLLLIAMSSAMLILSKTKGCYTTTFAQLQSMALVIAEVAIILGLMSFLPNPTNMIPSAIAIGILLNTLATSMLIMSKAKGGFRMSFAQLQSMALVMAEIAVILSLMSFLPNPTNMIPSAIAIGILLNALAAALVIASLAGSRAASAVSAMVVMGIVLAEVAIVLGLLSAFDIEPSIESALALSTLLLAMSAACLIVSLIPAGAGIAGAVQLAAFIGIMAAVIAAFGALALIPGFTTIMEKGSEIFTIIGEAIGGFCGGIISGIGSAIISLLPQLGMALSAFAVGVQPFINLVSRLDANVIAGAGYLTGAILALSAASFISGIQKILSFGQGSLTKLGAELCAFGIQVRIFATSIKDIDSSSIDAATNAAKMILALTASDFLSTLTEKFGGSTDFESLGENLKAFGEAVVSFSDIISGEIDVDAVEAATNAGALIVELNKSLPRSGGLLQDVIGEQDLGKFAAACTAFAGCILAINAVVTQEGFELDNDKIEQLVVAGEQFNRLNTALPRTGGLAQDLAGEQDLAGFGVACVAFAACMITINEAVKQDGFEIDNDKIEQLVVAGEQFNRLNTALPRSGGIAQGFAGEKDLEAFGVACKAFVSSMKTALSTMDGTTIDAEALESIVTAGNKLAELQGSLEPIGGVVDWFTGEKDLGSFGEKITSFANGMQSLSECNTINSETLANLIATTGQLSELQGSLKHVGGVIDWFIGQNDLGTFGTSVGAFASGMQALAECNTINSETLASLIAATSQLSELQGSLQHIGGVVDWFIGQDDLGTFGTSVATYASSMKTAFGDINGITYDETAFNSLVTASTKLSELQGSLEHIGGAIDWFIGQDDLGTFGESVATYASSMKTAFGDINGITYNEEAFAALISGSNRLSTLQQNLEHIGGVIDWFIGQDDLGTFGTSVATFASSMKTAFGDINGTTYDEEAFNSLVTASTKLSELQGSLEPIGGVVDWFIGRDDLGTFGTSVGSFADGMKSLSECTALDSTTIQNLIDAAGKLNDFQASLTDNVGGVIDWFVGNDDLGSFGTCIGQFADGMKSLSECTALDSTTIQNLISAAGELATLKTNLSTNAGGVIDWFVDNEDLGTFGTSIGQFADGMQSLSDCTALDSDTIQTLIDAAGELATLKTSLSTNAGGVIDWFVDNEDLGTFGTSIGQFADGMQSLSDCTALDSDTIQTLIDAAGELATLKTSLSTNADGVIDWFVDNDDLGSFGTSVGQFADGMQKLADCGMTDETLTNVINAGTALTDLIGNLPEEGLFDGKMNLTEFSDYITDLGTAMETFSTKAAEFDDDVVSTVINAAYRIKRLIESLVGLDASGVEAFTGVGTGNIGADGPAYDIACAIVKFGETIEDIDTGAVNLVITEAGRLKRLIAGLVGLDTSGVEKFKPGTIGDQMKTYSDKVAGIDTRKVSSSVSTANRLKNFIAGLVDLDISGVSKFNPGKIGTALATYSTKISGFNMGLVSSSISAANRLKNFISSLAGLDSSGVESFKAAVNELATVNMTELVKTFSGASEALSESGADIINGLINGMKSKLSILKTTANSINTTMDQAVRSKLSLFTKSGQMITSNLARGISSKRSAVVTATTSCVSGAASILRSYYTSFYSAGSYLVSGFCDGITANTYRAAAKAAAMANAAESAARQALDINSPSKVFREIGSGIPEGFALGIGMLGGEVKRSVVGMASTAVNATRSAMTTVLDALNADMDAQPTIRPVIDLSDVQNGANAIHGMLNGTQTIGVRSNLNAINATMNAKLQNGTNDDIISAINKLNAGLENNRGDVYNFGNFTYDDGSNISDAVQTLVRAARIGRRV